MIAKAGKRDKYNDFLDNNRLINSASDLKDKIKEIKKNHVLYLLGALVIGSVLTLLLSFTASVIGFGDAGSYFLISLLVNFICTIINNIIFVVFLKRTRNQKIISEDIVYVIKKWLPQLLCLLILSVTQTLVTILALNVTAVIPMLNVLLSLVISLVFTLMNAMVAFRVYDSHTKLREILPGACSVLSKNWKSLLFISLLFITWSYVSNVAFTNLLFSQIQEVQGINNIFHALLQQRDYMNLMYVAGFYGLNYVVAGFLEIDILLGLAIVYQRDRKLCYKEK